MQFELTKNERSTLADKAYQSLREQILSGQLQGGTRLRQHELARQLKITTNPLREALIHLERDGLVESEPSQGAKVREWKPEDFIKQFDVRIALESELAMLAAERISPVELQELVALAYAWDRHMLHSADGSLPAGDINVSDGSWFDTDVAIHHGIARAARSEKLMELWHIAILKPKQNRPASVWSELVKHCQAWSHLLLVQAIASRHGETARLAARRHVAFSRAIDIRALGLEWQFPQYVADGNPVAAKEDDFRELLDK